MPRVDLRLARTRRWLVVWVMVAATAASAKTPPDSTGMTSPDDSLFVRLQVQKRDLFVGETIPVDIQIGARIGVDASLDSPPTLQGDAFTLGALASEPEHEEKVIDGKLCSLLVWHTVLSAVKPGSFALTIAAPLTMRMRMSQNAEPSFVDESEATDPFTDPAFQSLFKLTTEKTVVASSEPMDFKVLALPMTGRPPAFSGAVGHFSVSSEVSKKSATAGDPLVLRMHVRGTGSFDRVNSAMLTHAAEWKPYQPTARFKPGDRAGYRGDKTFEQPIVATRPGLQQLPELEFVYFDPDSQRYEVARTVAISVDVSGPIMQASDPSNGHEATLALLLHGDHSEKSAPRSLVPLYYRPAFLFLPLCLIASFMAAWRVLPKSSC
jgi:hypothetical protein